jgi:peroxiredoxin
MRNYMSDLKVGDSAPDFELPVSGQERVKLSDAVQAGPVVLLAYVFDFTGG